MTTSDMLNIINENLEADAQSVDQVFQYHKQVEARASKTVENDIQSIQDTLTCLKGMCSLQWKPVRS